MESLAFCAGRALPQLKRPASRWLTSRPSAVATHAAPVADCTCTRRSARISRSHGPSEKSRKRTDQENDVNSVLHGLELGRGLRYQAQHPSSPRVAVLEKPALRSMLTKLHAAALSVIMDPETKRDLEFSSSQLEKVREEVSTTYTEGGKHLTVLSHLFANRLTDGHYSCKSILSADAAGNSFTLSQNVHADSLRNGADSLSLAEQQLRELRFDARSNADDDFQWAETKLVDHRLEFEADRHNAWGVHRIISHARSSNEYWKLMSDSLFGIDSAEHDVGFSNDEQLSMYTIKIVVDDDDHAEALQRNLRNFYWNDKELRDHGAPVDFATRRLELLDQSQPSAPRTSTFNWQQSLISVQVQTLDEHYEESELSHLKQNQEHANRRQLLADRFAAESPLFRFSREFLQWIGESRVFESPPSCSSIGVTVCC